MREQKVEGMKKVVILAVSMLLGISAIAQACDTTPHSVLVNVQGVRSDNGNVAILLYGNDPEEFLAKGKRLHKERVPARAGSVRYCIPIAEPGRYAVAVYHDENGNHDFDKNWIGIPVEGFGISNNPRMILGPPSHAESAFSVHNGEVTIDIRLNY